MISQLCRERKFTLNNQMLRYSTLRICTTHLVQGFGFKYLAPTTIAKTYQLVLH